MMVGRNDSHFGTGFTVSVEARDGVTTGISAADRARTVQVLVDPETRPDDLVMPGHMFPLRARDGRRARARRPDGGDGRPLPSWRDSRPAGVLCEIMNADGTMARLPQLKRFATRHGLKIISVNELISYRTAARTG